MFKSMTSVLTPHLASRKERPSSTSSSNSDDPGRNDKPAASEKNAPRDVSARAKLKRSMPTDSFQLPQSSDASYSTCSTDTSDSSDSEGDKEISAPIPGLAAQHLARTGTVEHRQSSDDSSSDQDDNAIGQLATASSHLPSAKRRKIQVSSREIDQLYHVSPPPTRRRSDIHPQHKESQSEIAQPTPSSTTKPTTDREDRRKQNATARIEKALGLKFDQIFTPWAEEDQDVSRNTLILIVKAIALMEDKPPQEIARLLNKAVNGGDGEGQAAGGSRPTISAFKDLITILQANKADETMNGDSNDTPLLPSWDEMTRPLVDQKTSQRIIPERAEATQHLAQTPPLLISHHPKLKRTTLAIRIPPSLEYLPLRLSECSTPLTFYTKILSAWNIREENVAKITATFTWMEAGDKMRTMVMNKAVDGCFEHLLEQVDEAPEVEEGGRARWVVDVDVAVKAHDSAHY